MICRVRMAEPTDIAVLLKMIRALARFHGDADLVTTTEESLRCHGFSRRPLFEALIAERNGAAVGYALFTMSFSARRGVPLMELDHLYVEAAARGAGVGTALCRAVARIAVDREVGRLRVTVEGWNAAKGFYEALGMRPLSDDRQPYFLDDVGLRRLSRTLPGR